jgi:hypothetical protein
MKMPMNPNLQRRPAKPALGNGRVQRGALRAAWALDGTATTSEVAEWTHAPGAGLRRAVRQSHPGCPAGAAGDRGSGAAGTAQGRVALAAQGSYTDTG